MKRWNVLGSAAAACFCFLVVYGAWGFVDSSDLYVRISYGGEDPFEEKHRDTPGPVTLAFVGDIMMDRGVRNSVYNHGGGDYRFLSEHLDVLREADIVFGNLEGPLSDRGRDVGGIYSFRMEPASIEALLDAGFDVLSVANNHSGDWTVEAFSDTLERLHSNGIYSVGGGRSLEEATDPVVIEREGTTFAFVGFTDVGPHWMEAGEEGAGVLLASGEYHEKTIERAASEADVVIVSYHFGEEYHSEPSARQKSVAQKSIDAGADLVIGHHPHVIQPLEWRDGSLVIYSLGNFIFDQYFSEETMTGLILHVTFEEGSMVGVEKRLVDINEQFRPFPREEVHSIDILYE